jgi:small subunit ribosomal protein S16
MLAIRMSRIGSKKRPVFRVVVTESSAARDSRFVESLGHYTPKARPAVVDLDRERYDYWIKVGARPSDSVRTLVAGHLTVKPAADTQAVATPAAPPATPEAPAQ